ncbi:MAG: PAS domain S-box protein [Candidatus Aminicenantes bacterium]|nr:PAS domain S-box protein [Candidatus Aminicenantes bacterium]
MSLKARISLFLVVTFLVFCVAIYGIYKLLIYPNYVQMEMEDARKNTEDCVKLLKGELATLNMMVDGWASWDDTYRFVGDPNSRDDYIKSNLGVEFFVNGKLNLLYILNTEREILWGKIYDLQSRLTVSLPEFSAQLLPGENYFFQHKAGDGSVKGVLPTRQGILLLVSRPILTSLKKGPSRGTFIMGRFLSEERLETLAQQSRIDFTIQPIPAAGMPEIMAQITTEQTIYISPEHRDKNYIHAYTTFAGVAGKPAFLIAVKMPRNISTRSTEIISTVILSAIAIGFLFIFFWMMYLQRTIVAPLSKLTRHTAAIRESDDLSLRCAVNREDEIGVLSREINHMVERLQQVRLELNRKLKVEINGHQKAEKSLRRDQEFLLQLFENSPFGIVVMDSQNKILNVNRKFEIIFQYSLEEAREKSIDDIIVPPEMLAEAKKLSTRTLEGEIVQYETIRKRKDGQTVDILLHGVPIYLENDQVGIYGMYLDITEQKQMQEEKNLLKDRLVEAKKMEAVGTLAGGMAHEFNNLMAIILGNIELLINSGIENQVMRKRLDAIKTSADRSATLTNQLLSFSRKQMLKLERLDFNDLVGSIGYMMRNVFGEGVKQEIILAPQLDPIEGDQSQLAQVIMDIVQNACDAMPEKGRLTIKTENVSLDDAMCLEIPESRPGRFICISVNDTGIGMDQETLKHIFEPFFTTKLIKNSTGLGLAFVYGTVKQHNGWLNVYSEEGKGATFKIYLPVMSREAD